MIDYPRGLTWYLYHLAPVRLPTSRELPAAIRALLYSVPLAGAVFVGPFTAQAAGDYAIGSNHVLPTARSARFASGLGVLDFMKRTSLLGCDPASLAALAPATITLAEVEGLEAHGRSVSIRLNG